MDNLTSNEDLPPSHLSSNASLAQSQVQQAGLRRRLLLQRLPLSASSRSPPATPHAQSRRCQVVMLLKRPARRSVMKSDREINVQMAYLLHLLALDRRGFLLLSLGHGLLHLALLVGSLARRSLLLLGGLLALARGRGGAGLLRRLTANDSVLGFEAGEALRAE